MRVEGYPVLYGRERLSQAERVPQQAPMADIQRVSAFVMCLGLERAEYNPSKKYPTAEIVYALPLRCTRYCRPRFMLILNIDS